MAAIRSRSNAQPNVRTKTSTTISKRKSRNASTADPVRNRDSTPKRDSVTFRPTAEERRILDRLSDEGVTASDAVRRGLHLVAHEKWLDQARTDAKALADENLSDEPDAW